MSILSTKVQYIVPQIFKGGYNLQHISVEIFLLIDDNCNVHMVPSKIIYLRYLVIIYIFISLSYLWQRWGLSKLKKKGSKISHWMASKYNVFKEDRFRKPYISIL